MTYRCRCENGPAKGTEFQEYGPQISVALRHKGSTLEYRLSSIQEDVCIYHVSESNLAPPAQPVFAGLDIEECG